MPSPVATTDRVMPSSAAASAASTIRGSSENPSVNSTMWRRRAFTSRSPAIASSSALTTSVGPSGCSRARASSTVPESGTCCSGRTQFASALNASTPTVSCGASAPIARATPSLVMSVLLTPPSTISPLGPPGNPSSRQWHAAIEPDTSTTSASATDGRRSGSRTRANTGSRSSSIVPSYSPMPKASSPPTATRPWPASRT